MASDLIFPALSIVRLLLAVSPLGRSLKDDPQLSSPLTSYSSRKSVRAPSHRFLPRLTHSSLRQQFRKVHTYSATV